MRGMKGLVSRRFILAGLMSSAAGAVAGAPLERTPYPTLRPGGLAKLAAKPSDQLIARSGLSGTVGFVVADAKTGLVLESKHAGKSLPPASVAKAMTSLYAFDALGLDHRFATRVIATGPISNGRLRGDLVLVGGGDPTLTTDALGDLAKGVKAAGIREVSGKFLVYAEALPYVRAIDDAQPDHLGYNPSVSGLNLNFNRVHFEWRRAQSGYAVTMDARAERYRPEVRIADMRVVNRDLPVYTYKDTDGRDRWTVARSALGKGGTRWLPVRKPELYAAEVFRTLARSHGVVLPKEKLTRNRPQGKSVATVGSAPLADIARDMLKYSTNLTAEVLGLAASQSRGNGVAGLRASGQRMSSWAKQKYGIKSADFADHSGLSDKNRITASDMVRALVAAGPQSALHRLMKEIPLRDDDYKVLPVQPAHVRAKTGTLNFVSALAGYITAPDGTELAFAIFTADLPTRAAIKKADREVPQGGRKWSRTSRQLQQELLQRWITLYGT